MWLVGLKMASKLIYIWKKEHDERLRECENYIEKQKGEKNRNKGLFDTSVLRYEGKLLLKLLQRG